MRLRSRELLRECIAVQGISERSVAARAGLAHSTVNHLVSGRRDTCSAQTARALEGALGCSPGLLFAPRPT
jgi:plasmid maintenance system antidote protein VapI